MNLGSILSLIENDDSEPNKVMVFSLKSSTILYEGEIANFPEGIDLGARVRELSRAREFDDKDITGSSYRQYFVIKVY